MTETVKEVALHYIFGRTFHHGKGGGLALYIWEDIPSRLLHCKSQCNEESLSVEINLRKRKWFLNCSCNSHGNSILRHLEFLNCVIDEHSKTYRRF